MRVIIWGKVTQRHLDDADLMVGITPTSYVTNGTTVPPASNLPVTVFPICDKQPETTRERANHYTLVHNADALICVGKNEHLVELAKRYELPVYEVDG